MSSIGLWGEGSKKAYFCKICSSGPYLWPTPKCSRCSGEDRVIRIVETKLRKERIDAIDHTCDNDE